MASIAELIVSRQKSAAMLRARIAEYESQIATFGPLSPAGLAVGKVVKVDKQRLARLEEEISGLLTAIPPSPQVDLPGVTGTAVVSPSPSSSASVVPVPPTVRKR